MQTDYSTAWPHYAPNSANAEAKAAIKAFLSAKTNQDLFDRWQDAVVAIADIGTARNWFYYWCYQEIKITDERDGREWCFAPFGFEYFGAKPVACGWKSTTAHGSIAYIPLEQATIRIPSPAWLYQKLNIC